MKIIEGKKVYSVSEVNFFGKQTLEQLIISVEGEISSFQQNPAWFNTFFSLSDGIDIIECFISSQKFTNSGADFIGKKVIVNGRLTLFKKNQYKMEAFSIKEEGDGLLQKRTEELFNKLKDEGLFDPEKKKEIPLYPVKVCIITSENSAGWKDFKTHTQDKFPLIELTTADVRVEGARAVSQLLEILPKVDSLNYDVIVITRGGGSQESLLEVFNNEQLVRKIFSLKTPKIVAIGHEINVSLCELVADKRASTPTDAANIVIAGFQNLLDKLDNFDFRFRKKLETYSYYFQHLDTLSFKLSQLKVNVREYPHQLSRLKEILTRHQKHLIFDAEQKIAELLARAKRQSSAIFDSKGQTLAGFNKSLSILSPQNVLSRGYSITTDSSGSVVRDIQSVVVGQQLGVKLARGSLATKILSKNEKS